MKILHIYKCYSDPPAGGVEQTIKQISLGLKNIRLKMIFLQQATEDKNYNYGKKLFPKNYLKFPLVSLLV